MWVALEWIEAHCIVPDGFRKGQPFKLYRYQGEYLANFYLVRGDAPWVPANPVLAPAFVYRRGLLVGPQKVGKNPLIATQVCLEGAGPSLFAGFAAKDEGWACADHGCRCGWEYPYDEGEPRGMLRPTPLIQITAFSEDSTENTYDALRPMIDDGPLHDLIPKTGEEFIRLPGGGRIDTVTSSNQSRLGQRVTFVPQDELGLWTAQNKMVKLADTQYRGLSGMSGRASLTSNAWDPAENSVAQREYDSAAQDVYRQFIQPPRTLSYADKRERHRIHLAVYPDDTRRENDGHLDLDSIEAEAADLAAKDMPQAQRFYGNILVAGAGHAVDPDVWDKLGVAGRILYPDGKPSAGTEIGIGFDGSMYSDATVLRGCTRDGFSFILGLWVPSHEKPVPRAEVHETVASAFSVYRVGRMYCDPWGWQTEIEGWQNEYGMDADGKLTIVQPFDFRQRRNFAHAVDRWLAAIAEGTHTHDADPLTTEHIQATHKVKVVLAEMESDRTMYVLDKGADKRRIDAAIADVLAYEAAMTMSDVTEQETLAAWA
jgi:hypothetical protein